MKKYIVILAIFVGGLMLWYAGRNIINPYVDLGDNQRPTVIYRGINPTGTTTATLVEAMAPVKKIKWDTKRKVLRRPYFVVMPHEVILDSGGWVDTVKFNVGLSYQIVMRRVQYNFPGRPDIAEWGMDSVNVVFFQGVDTIGRQDKIEDY